MAYKLTTDKTWSAIEADIREQLSRWGAVTYSLTRPNVAAGKSVRSSWNETPEQALVALSVQWRSGRELRLQYNKQARAVDNARVLFKAIEALRLNEVRGIDDVMREAYLRLPAPEQQVRERDPWEVLGLRDDAPNELIEPTYKALAKSKHPDAGGSEAAFKELHTAYERVKVMRGLG